MRALIYETHPIADSRSAVLALLESVDERYHDTATRVANGVSEGYRSPADSHQYGFLIPIWA